MPSVTVMTPKRNGRRRRNGCSNASTPSTLSFGANGGATVIGALFGRARAQSSQRSQVRGDEGVVGEVGVLAADAVDRLALAGAQALARIEAPRAFEQALAAQHLVAAGDAAVEVVGDVEEGAVAVGDAAVEREQLGVDARRRAGILRGRARLAALEQLDRAFRPHRPVAEQAAAKAHRHRRAVALGPERRDRSRTMWSSLPV